MEDRNYGTIRIKLDEMIEKQNISKNKLACLLYTSPSPRD